MKNKAGNIAIVFFLTATVLPLVLGFSYALRYSLGLAGILNIGFTTEYWKNAFTVPELFDSLVYSLMIVSITIVVSIAIALFFVLFFRRRISRGKTSYILYVPLAIPALVAAFLGLQVLSNSGFLARIAAWLHLLSDPQQFPDLVNGNFPWAILVTHIFITSVFFILLFLSIYKNEKLHQFHDVALSLGSDRRSARKKILIPILLTRSLPSIVLYAIFIFGSYEIPLLLGSQQPQMISVIIARKFQRYNLQDIPVAYIMACIYTIFVTLIVFILYRKNKLFHEEQG